MSDRVVLTDGEREWPLTLHGDGRVEADGRAVRVAPVGPGAWRVEEDGRALLVHTASDERGTWVHAGGVVHVLTMGAHAVTRSRAAGSDSLSSPMPATVRAVTVTPGAAVQAGDTLVMLEAMKMELAVRAPRDGTVAAVHCREGELVEPGRTLVELE